MMQFFAMFFIIIVTSFLLSLVLGKIFITYAGNFFKALARDLTPANHQAKNYTPTMGGLFVVVAVIGALFFCSSLSWSFFGFICLAIGAFGSIGAWDDWAKIRYKQGISERKKFFGQAGVAALVVLVWFFLAHPEPVVMIPLFNYVLVLPSLIFGAWAVWVIICTMNAVNLTDGLDGLAATLLIMNFIVFAVIAGLMMPYGHEVALVAGAFVGALLGFLWFNGYPAQVFMGDIGSLAFGGMLALLALMIQREMLIPIAGIVFVLEGVSVSLQVLIFKKFKFRLFKMAPLHHHFELSGWHEATVTMRFAIVTLISCLLALFIALA